MLTVANNLLLEIINATRKILGVKLSLEFEIWNFSLITLKDKRPLR